MSNVQTKNTELEHMAKTDQNSFPQSPKPNMASHSFSATTAPSPSAPPVVATVTASCNLFTPLDEMTKHDTSALVMAINSMHGMIRATQLDIATALDNKFSSLNSRMDTLQQQFVKQDQTMREIALGSVAKSDLERVESNINSVASEVDEMFEHFSAELESVKSSLEFYKMENMRLKHRLYEIEEKLNFKEIQSKRYSLYIDGLLEAKDKNIKSLILEKFNNEADVGLVEGDILSAKRVGIITKYRKNRSISLVVTSEESRDKFLKARGKLTPEIVNSPIWINEEIPQSYRRRKSMLRDLVKLAQARKYKAKIEQGGISLDGKLYLPHQFKMLPQGLQPMDACHKTTDDGGTAFASEWSPFSNLHRINFKYRDIWFNSVEQCYQFRKANAEGHEDTAELILSLTDPYQCKKEGEQHKESKKWQKVCDAEMTKIVVAKFSQNEEIMQVLQESEGPLYEATTDDYWGTGYSLRSKETVSAKNLGLNKLGLILVALREGSIDCQSADDAASEGDSLSASEETSLTEETSPAEPT